MRRPFDADLDDRFEPDPPDDGFEDEAYDDEDDYGFEDEAYDDDEPDPDLEADAHREQEALERAEAWLPFCVVCGCTAVNACPGGCVWATETLCSRSM